MKYMIKRLVNLKKLKKDLYIKYIKKSHLGIDIKEYYVIYNYLKSIDNVDKSIVKKADNIYLLLSDLTEEFD